MKNSNWLYERFYNPFLNFRPTCFEPISPQMTSSTKELQSQTDFQTVSRFENFGGGWGYSGHSVEAIRFMADTDILLCELRIIDLDIIYR